MIQGVNEANSSSKSDFLRFSLPSPSFLVGQDGGVYEGVGWTIQGSHTYGYNDIALGIAFIGNFVGKV